MSYFDRIWAGLKSVIQLESDVARLTAKVEQLDARERETRERLIYLEGVIAGEALWALLEQSLRWHPPAWRCGDPPANPSGPTGAERRSGKLLSTAG